MILNKKVKAANFNIDTINQKLICFWNCNTRKKKRKKLLKKPKLIVDLKELVTSILMTSDLSRQKE